MLNLNSYQRIIQTYNLYKELDIFMRENLNIRNQLNEKLNIIYKQIVSNDKGKLIKIEKLIIKAEKKVKDSLFREGISIFEEALLISKKIFNDEYELKISIKLGFLNFQISNFIISLEYYEKGLALCKINSIGRSKKLKSKMKCKILNFIGLNLRELEEYGKSQLMFEKALKISKNSLEMSNELCADLLNNYAAVLYDLGDIEEAKLLVIQSKTLIESIIGKTNTSYLNAIFNLALIFNSLKKFNDSKILFEESILILKELENYCGTQILIEEKCFILQNFAIVLKNIGNYEESIKYLKQALDIRAIKANRENEISIIYNLANFCYLGNFIDDSIFYFQKSLIFLNEDIKDQNQTLIEVYQKLSNLYFKKSESLKEINEEGWELKNNVTSLSKPSRFSVNRHQID